MKHRDKIDKYIYTENNMEYLYSVLDNYVKEICEEQKELTEINVSD